MYSAYSGIIDFKAFLLKLKAHSTHLGM